MRAEHLEFLVEEPSMEAFLRGLLPRLLGDRATFEVYPHQGKQDLLQKLPQRLRGYASFLPDNYRIVVVVDRDDDDCRELKRDIERIAAGAGLSTRASTDTCWQVVNRIAIEELEAWYFGDWAAVRDAFPRVSASIPLKAPYRDPDGVRGGTWEAFERVLQTAGYFRSGLPKIGVARELGVRIDPDSCRSDSFRVLRDAVVEAVT